MNALRRLYRSLFVPTTPRPVRDLSEMTPRTGTIRIGATPPRRGTEVIVTAQQAAPVPADGVVIRSRGRHGRAFVMPVIRRQVRTYSTSPAGMPVNWRTWDATNHQSMHQDLNPTQRLPRVGLDLRIVQTPWIARQPIRSYPAFA